MSARDPLELVRSRLTDLLGVRSDVELDLDQDLLAGGGYEVDGQVVDSMTLVDVLTTLEDEYGGSIQRLIDRDDTLTLRSVLNELDVGSSQT